MTREEILALPAGPELDVLIAEKVMGKPGWFCEVGLVVDGISHQWRPSTDGNAMMQVMDTLAARGVYLSLHRRGRGYTCEAWNDDYRRIVPVDSKGETASHAVALMALLAVEQP